MARSGQDELNLSLAVALGRAMHGLKKRLLPLLAADGLTAGQFDALKALHAHGPLCVNELLERTLSSSGNIDVVLDNLLDKRLICKGVDPADRRRRIVRLSDQGREYVQKRFPEHIQALRRSLNALATPEKRQLRELLAKLADNL